MKKTLTLLVALLLYSSYTFAQYCGHYGNPSGTSQCTPSGTLATPGFTPNEDIPCINRSQLVNTVIQFQCYDTIRLGGQVVTVQSWRIDSIGNLPSGICWTTNKANNTFNNQESGCIKLSGATSAPPGQYKLLMIVTMNIGISIQINVDAIPIKMYLRVTDQSFSFCPPVDTSQNTPYQTYSGNVLNVAEITGRLFYDVNSNQTFDNGEQGIGGKIIDVGNGYVAATLSNGNYYAYVPAGTYTLKPNERTQFPYSPDSLTVNAASVGTSYGGNNFAVIIPQGFCDGYLAVASVSTPPRPGFNNRIIYSYTNALSSAPVSFTAVLRYNTGEVFVSANPAPSLIDTVTRTLQWDVNNVASSSSWHTEIVFYNPPTTPLSTIRYYTGSVLNSSCTGMDSAVTEQQVQVVGSYDPNDKAVSPAGFGADGRIIPSTGALKYTIRFQNTGTYLAENVKVIDTISTLLDLSSFKLMATSHPCEVIIKGREVTFAFNGIQLADSFSNEPASHGYIQYSINPLPAFVNGSVITNRADIYFDFNAPILTNTTRTTGDINAGIAGIQQNVFQFAIYPNPNSNSTLQLEADPQLIGEVVEIKDINGRLISRTPITATNITLPLTGMPAGVYLVKAGNLVKRLVRE
jgi:hypothetical protein